MSGIFGYLHHNNNKIEDTKIISSLLLWNQAYGRNMTESVHKKQYGMGCCYDMFSTHPKLQHPVIHNNDRYAVIDAVIYNREELLKTLSLGSLLSDEELLLAYIDTYGLTSLHHINGDFCGAIYNEKTKNLILFRDHMGIRPLYYHTSNNFIAFSTDIRGLTSLPQIDVTINEEWIYRKMSGFLYPDIEATEYKQIHCVKPGSYMLFHYDADKLEIQKKTYWELGKNKVHLKSEKEYQKTLRELITDSVSRRLNVTSGLIGAELSGGLDSGVIDILINRLGRKCKYFSWSPNPSIVPLVEKDERLIIEDICKQENISCDYSDIYSTSDKTSTISEYMNKMGIPIDYNEDFAFRYIMPAYTDTDILSETADFFSKHGIKVAFTGHGGDEGVSHRSNPFEMLYHHEFWHYFKFMWSTTIGQKHRFFKMLRISYRNIKDSFRFLSQPFCTPLSASHLLQDNFAQQFSHSKMPALYFPYNPKRYINGGGSRNRLDNLALQGAYSGIRYMIPFLDYRVIDYAISIPRHLYMKGKINRYIFREAFKDMIPTSLYNQTSKEDYSRRNIEKPSNWNENFSKLKCSIINRLHPEYWARCLNFEIINEWLHSGPPSTEDELFKSQKMIASLYPCAMAQNVLDRTREIYEQNTKKDENADS